MKLLEALQQLEKYGNEGLEIPESFSEFMDDKIDYYHTILTRLEKEAERCEEIFQQYYSMAESRHNEMTRFKAWILGSMKERGFNKVSGKKHAIQIVKRSHFKILRHAGVADCDLGDIVFIEDERKYSWDQKKLKEVCLQSPEEYQDIAKFVDIEYVKIK